MMPTASGRCIWVTSTPVITADSVITVPMERSIPPEMITKVTPRASTPTTAVASRMPTMLSNCRKFGDASEKKTMMMISAPKASRRWTASPRHQGAPAGQPGECLIHQQGLRACPVHR